MASLANEELAAGPRARLQPVKLNNIPHLALPSSKNTVSTSPRLA
jgi:hypothetical protein